MVTVAPSIVRYLQMASCVVREIPNFERGSTTTRAIELLC